MMGGAKPQYDCIKAFSETDITEDLKQIDVPVLIMHGDDDQIVPIADSAHLAIKLVKNGTLKVYPGLPHGMCSRRASPGCSRSATSAPARPSASRRRSARAPQWWRRSTRRSRFSPSA